MQLYITVFAFIFYRIAFKFSYEENLSILANILICLFVFAATIFITLQAAAILMDKKNIGDPYDFEREKVRGQSFKDILFFTIFLLVPFNFISILVIFGFSDNLWDYGIIEDGYLLVTAAILSTPVIIHALFVYRCTKLKFKKF